MKLNANDEMIGNIVKRKKKYIRKINKHQDIINNYLIEGISNVDTIKGSHLEKRLIDKFNIKYTSLLNTVNFYKILLEITYNIRNNLNEVLIIIIYSIGTYLCITNKLTLSNLIIFQAFTNYLLNNFYSILSLIEEYPNFVSAKERVEEFLNNGEYKLYKSPTEGNAIITLVNVSLVPNQ